MGGFLKPHSFYTPSLSSLEMIELRSGREIKNKQKDNPRPDPRWAGLLVELLWICIWFMIGFAMKGHTKTSSVISPISHLADLSCDKMTVNVWSLTIAKHHRTNISVIAGWRMPIFCQYFALHCWSEQRAQQQTVTSRHSHIWLENHWGLKQTKTWRAGAGEM